MTHKSFVAHSFDGIASLPFSAKEYSQLKFGSDRIARKFGYELADAFFKAHADVLLVNNCVVIPSPYNHVKNAASIMTEHFVDRLNHLLVNANGNHVETSIIHRKVSYTNDYGFLSKEKRRSLIDNDNFYLNRQFIKGKVLIFVDDVRITGTHEDKLVDILTRERLKNDAFFLYYGDYIKREVGCDIEAEINFAGITDVASYVELAKEPHHHIIVRPIKFLLKQPEVTFNHVLREMSDAALLQIYNGCLGEGYYRIPEYQANFGLLSNYLSPAIQNGK